MSATVARDEAAIGAAAAAAVYRQNEPGGPVRGMPGFVFERQIACAGPDTGFDAAAFLNPQAGWRILAIRGTDEGLDLLACTSLGTCQYLANREPLMRWIADAAWRRFSLVGHSLGGAICQYLAYDLALTHPSLADRVDLLTYNGVGGVIGLCRMHGAIDEAVCRRIRCHHFAHPGDIVPRIGGNIGGEVRLLHPSATLHPDPHNLAHFLGGGLGDQRIRCVRDSPFGVSASAEVFGDGLRLAVEDWLAGSRWRATRRVIGMLPDVPSGERRAIAKLAIAIGASVFRARRKLARCGRPAGADARPAVPRHAPPETIAGR